MDDVLQDVYVKAYLALSRFRGEASIGSWLYRITYNACMDQLRRDASRPRAVMSYEDFEQAGSPALSGREASSQEGVTRTGTGTGRGDYEDVGDTVARRQDLAAALATLSAESRGAVLLVDAEGYSYADAAEILGVKEGTVASRLHQARRTLRRTLGEDW
jgi:RNA polymerase sigma-70 factor (ECF subfamily)